MEKLWCGTTSRAGMSFPAWPSHGTRTNHIPRLLPGKPRNNSESHRYILTHHCPEGSVSPPPAPWCPSKGPSLTQPWFSYRYWDRCFCISSLHHLPDELLVPESRTMSRRVSRCKPTDWPGRVAGTRPIRWPCSWSVHSNHLKTRSLKEEFKNTQKNTAFKGK